MQRALRTNEESRALWLHYFVMEVKYVERLRTRRHILGIDGARGVSDNGSMGPGDGDGGKFEAEGHRGKEIGKGGAEEDSINALLGEEEKSGAAAAAATTDTVTGIESGAETGTEIDGLTSSSSATTTPAQRLFLEGAVPKIVFRNAVRSISREKVLPFCGDCLSVCRDFRKRGPSWRVGFLASVC